MVREARAARSGRFLEEFLALEPIFRAELMRTSLALRATPTQFVQDCQMESGNPKTHSGRGRRFQRLAGAGLISALPLTAVSFTAAILPDSVAGATNPASLNCGTLEIQGTDGNTYQFSEFTTGNSTRSGSDAAAPWLTVARSPRPAGPSGTTSVHRQASSRPWWAGPKPAS